MIALRHFYRLGFLDHSLCFSQGGLRHEIPQIGITKRRSTKSLALAVAATLKLIRSLFSFAMLGTSASIFRRNIGENLLVANAVRLQGVQVTHAHFYIFLAYLRA